MDFLLDILFPKKCVGCKKDGSYICGDCIKNIKQTDLVCPKCEKLSVGGQLHPICCRKYGLDGLWSLGVYEGSLKEAIRQLKYKGVKELSQSLVDIMIEYWAAFQPFILDRIKKDNGQGWSVVPVPLHWFRQNDRGFNQAVLLGKYFAQSLGLDYSEDLKRIRFTKPQVRLKGKQRYQNVKGVFEISKPYTQHAPLSEVNPSPYILLIDDVWTTGSTMRECTYVLKRNGAKQVWALTLAR